MTSFKSILILINFMLITDMVLSLPPLQIEAPSGYKSFLKSPELKSKKDSSRNEFRYRLPITVNPISYKVKLMPILMDVVGYEKFTAPGEVTIKMESTVDSNVLCFHQYNLTMDESSVKLWRLEDNGDHGAEMSINDQSYDEIKEFHCLNLTDVMTKGEDFELFVKFTAAVSQLELYGVYLSQYVEPISQETRYLAATHFQPTNTRKAFPCFDEPALKATFEIILGRHENFHSLSNMNKAEPSDPHETLEKWWWDTYKPTPVMSPYLVAFVISDLANEEPEPGLYDKPVNVWAAPYIKDQGSITFAAEATAKSLALFDSLFDIDYFMPKMDAVALPQFSSAMENTGLNLYRYELFLYTPNESTEEDRKLVNLVVGHEVSHQWMGDLVTCSWWSETWLNEGFARYLQYWSMRVVTPEFEPDVILISDVVHEAMNFDQGPDTHPLKHEVGTPEEVELIFDEISYDKGSSIIRMMEAFLTPKIFLDGLQVYLKNRQFSDAVQEHLFEALDSVAAGASLLPADVTVSDIMNTWTLQSGYPIVRVSKGPDDQIYLSQEKFKTNSNKMTNQKLGVDSTWYIPVTVVSANDPRSNFLTTWISNNVTLMPFKTNFDLNKWIIINPDQIGFYRVLYDTQLRKLIHEQLETDSSVISPGTRSQILNDYFHFANEKYVSFSTALSLTTYLANETELVVWTPVLIHLQNILTKFSADSSATQTFKEYFMPKFEAALNSESIGWTQSNGEKGPQVIVRAKLLDYACTFNHPNCVTYSKSLFTLWQATPTDRTIIPADIRPIVFCSAVTHGDETIWSQVMNLYSDEKNEMTKSYLYKALACSQRVDILERFLELAYFGVSFEITSAIQNVAKNSAGRDLAYNYIKQKYKPNGIIGQTQFANVIQVLSDYWNRQDQIDDLLQFIAVNAGSLGSVMQSLTESISKIEQNINWWEEEGATIQSWMKIQIYE